MGDSREFGPHILLPGECPHERITPVEPYLLVTDDPAWKCIECGAYVPLSDSSASPETP